MSVFIVEGDRVRPSVHALTLSPFKEIWERDTSEHKGRAITEFSYIEFMLSYAKTNVFRGYGPDLKGEVIIKKLFPQDPGWRPDTLVLRAMEEYREFQDKASLAKRFYDANRVALERMIVFYRTFDMDARNNSGNPIYKPKDITGAITEMEDALKAMDAAEERVREELYEAIQTMKKRELNPFETGDLVV
jgi:hypothetical protein